MAKLRNFSPLESPRVQSTCGEVSPAPDAVHVQPRHSWDSKSTTWYEEPYGNLRTSFTRSYSSFRDRSLLGFHLSRLLHIWVSTVFFCNTTGVI